jgi:hypothetical protein
MRWSYPMFPEGSRRTVRSRIRRRPAETRALRDSRGGRAADGIAARRTILGSSCFA